jgi:hypothetical protein
VRKSPTANCSAVPNRANLTERKIAGLLLRDFHANGSGAVQTLQMRYPEDERTRRSLYSLASLVSALAGVTLHRDYARRKELLFKWFDDNFEVVEPYLRLFAFDPR